MFRDWPQPLFCGSPCCLHPKCTQVVSKDRDFQFKSFLFVCWLPESHSQSQPVETVPSHVVPLSREGCREKASQSQGDSNLELLQEQGCSWFRKRFRVQSGRSGIQRKTLLHWAAAKPLVCDHLPVQTAAITTGPAGRQGHQERTDSFSREPSHSPAFACEILE